MLITRLKLIILIHYSIKGAKFYNLKVINYLTQFKELADVIVGNRIIDNL
jgi:hypothetical protein